MQVLTQVLLRLDNLAGVSALSSTCRVLAGTSDHLMLAQWCLRYKTADDAIFLAAQRGWYHGVDANGFRESTGEFFGGSRLPIGAAFPSGLAPLGAPEVRADPDAPCGALYLAAEFASLESLSILLSPLSPVDANSRGDTPSNTTALHKAAGSGSLAAVRLLLSKGAQVCVRDHMENLPLSLACQSSNRPEERAEIVRSLLSVHASTGATLTFQQAIDWVSDDLYPFTPVHWAANSGLHRCCEVLLSSGSQALHMRTPATFPRVSSAIERNRTPLDLCILRLQDASLAAEENDPPPGSLAARLAGLCLPSTAAPATSHDFSALAATKDVLLQWIGGNQ
eukprot:scaffold60281_cov17-Tisochrysis_lutea.AAC.1